MLMLLSMTVLGAWADSTFGGGDNTLLYLGANSTLYYPSKAMSINACRAYFQLNGIEAGTPAGVRAFRLSFGEDDATGIVPIDNGKLIIDNEAGAWYTLDGRKLDGKPTRKGLYLLNGRKVVIK